MSKADNNAMNELHALVAEKLKDKILSGNCTAAEMANAIRFLKDNGVEADISNNAPLQSLAHQFPDFDQDDENEARIN